MAAAREQARLAAARGEVPVGAVVVRGDEIIAAAGNRVEELDDATAHAEMLALAQASRVVGDWRLTGCLLVATLEPCAMCAGGAYNSRVDGVVFGAADPRLGALGSAQNVYDALPAPPWVVGGVDGEIAGQLLKDFFAARRREPKYKDAEEGV